MKALSFTGHRPNKLGGYGGERAKKIRDGIFTSIVSIIKRAVANGFDTFISGGALGTDQIVAEAVIWVRKQPGYEHIKLIIAKPFPSQGSAWPQHAQDYFESICAQADKVVVVSDDPYTREKMQIRNEWMVDISSACCAVWNGGNGGTGNCVRYAKSKYCPILVVNPYTLVEKWELPSKVRW